MSEQAIVQQSAKVVSLQGYLDQRRSHLEAALPKSRGLTAERLVKLAVLATSKQPKLKECDMGSVFLALMQCAELGLEPSGTLGQAYLVPFMNRKSNRMECQLIIGYRGLIDLARRSGALRQIEAHVVHERDVFRLRFGLEPLLEHEPALSGDPGKARLVYCVATLGDGAKHVEVMTMPEVESIRARSKSKDSGPWVTDFEEMARKTAARRACKWIPMSSELAKALEAEEVEEGATHHESGPIIEATVEPPKTRTKRLAREISAKAKGPIVDVQPGETEEEASARQDDIDPNTGEVIPPLAQQADVPF